MMSAIGNFFFFEAETIHGVKLPVREIEGIT
jgi:hypothetical protein